MYPELISPFLARLIAQNRHHPALTHQFTYNKKELKIASGELTDPLDDTLDTVAPRLIHRYPHKALWLVNDTCASNCRFCFRKMLRTEQPALDIDAVYHYLSLHPEVNELIFSGGDPLLLPFSATKRIIDQFLSLEHLRIFRWHTRLPLFAPQLLPSDLFSLWSDLIKQGREVVVVLHLNHALELTPELTSLVEKMLDLSIKVKAQGVLLKNVNDNPTTLATLWKNELNIGIEPYYLHHLDHVCGTSHFRLSLPEGLKIYNSASKLFANPAHQPKYIVDLGHQGKTEVAQFLKN